ncbi:MAG: HEPN domain-containing protein [Lachnospiraceae bacterium]|nr:HEPN domain-containing protein [Lachnospiraceae bacterium]
MEDKYYTELVRIRMERADELLRDAAELLGSDSYKSANNRAYYAIEKAVNALLIDRHVETKTHNGAMKMFNVEYVRTEDAYFTDEDYRLIAKAEQIRSVSDYDDFYVASKEEARQQVEDARYLIEKIKNYFTNGKS